MFQMLAHGGHGGIGALFVVALVFVAVLLLARGCESRD